MEARIVVSFRAIGGAGRPFLERARALSARCSAIGGVHIGLDVLKTTYAFESARFAEVLDLVITAGADTEGEEPLWAVGIAQGDLRKVEEKGSPILASGLLWWGPPFVAASALASLARTGEILCAQTVPAIRAGQLVTSGLRIARDGTLRVRGSRVDRRQPWKAQAAKNLERLREPRLFTAHLPPVSMVPEKLLVVRGDPGSGGTRYLVELARRAQKSLLLSPVGSGFEPFGALRRALGRVANNELDPLLLELSPSLEALTGGRGVSLDEATKLVTAHLWPKPGQTSLLLVDDAKAVDAATLEAVVRAVRASPSIAAVARLDATSSLPSILAQLPRSKEVEIPALSREGAEEIAARATGGALDALARGRWARLGGGSPLAVLEALMVGVAAGDIAWSADRASPRSRAAGRGEIRPAAKWIRQRANAEGGSARALLSLLAVVGGEANVGFLGRVLERAKVRIDLAQTLDGLERARWIVRTQEAAEEIDVWVAFPARSHHKTLFNTLDDEARRGLHRAVALVLAEENGVFGKVEGAWHAAQAGEVTAASSIFLGAAAKAAEHGLEASTTQLIAFARRIDPACEEQAIALLGTALAQSPSAHPPAVSMPPSATPPVTAPPVPLFVPAAPAIPFVEVSIATLSPAGPMTVVPAGSLAPGGERTPAVTVVPASAPVHEVLTVAPEALLPLVMPRPAAVEPKADTPTTHTVAPVVPPAAPVPEIPDAAKALPPPSAPPSKPTASTLFGSASPSSKPGAVSSSGLGQPAPPAVPSSAAKAPTPPGPRLPAVRSKLPATPSGTKLPAVSLPSRAVGAEAEGSPEAALPLVGVRTAPPPGARAESPAGSLPPVGARTAAPGARTMVPSGSLPPAGQYTLVPGSSFKPEAPVVMPPPVVISAAALAELPAEPTHDPDSTIEHARVARAGFGDLELDLEDLETQELDPEDLVEVVPSLPPPAPRLSDLPPGFESSPPSSSGPGGQIALRLGELAKDALLAADNAALERWVDGLKATGESPVLAERLRAMAWLGRGDIGDALRVLRRTRARLDPGDHARRCQTSLALGVALNVDGRPIEALLETLDALARARQIDDERGARACLAFLAKLYSSVMREEEAALIRDASP